MSIIRCENCSKLIDTDDRPDTYYENLDMWLCDECYPHFERDDVEEYDLHHGGLQQRKDIVE